MIKPMENRFMKTKSNADFLSVNFMGSIKPTDNYPKRTPQLNPRISLDIVNLSLLDIRPGHQIRIDQKIGKANSSSPL